MLEFLKDTIKQAGDITLKYREKGKSLGIDRKSSKDLVTEADVAVEEYIVSQIKEKYPEHAILGEESGKTGGNEYRWIIDPIDGTTSFIHDQPFYSVSIGLEKEGEMILGAVYGPALDELFYAEKDKGAFLNDHKIKVSDTDEIVDSCLATGFACLRENLEHNNLPYFNVIAAKARGVRRFGSAALDMCYTACGRMDGFWELNLKIYDIAAGMVILREAGGKITDFDGKEISDCSEIAATNGKLHDKLIDILSRIKSDTLKR